MILLFFILTLSQSILCNSNFRSQLEQDKFINDHFFKNKKNGIFIDIGAHNGETFSNTYFFEKELNWSGICFEPLPHLFEKLLKTRNSICIEACVSSKEGIVPFIHCNSCDEMLSGIAPTYDKRQLDIVLRDTKQYGGNCKILMLPSVILNNTLQKYNITEIDYLSIDTEGSELEILKSINFDKFRISVISVENNYNEPFIKQFLESKNYKFVTRLHVDDVYYNTDLIIYS